MNSSPPARVVLAVLVVLVMSFGVSGQPDTSYGCPMHPEFRSSSPGTCPRCGMALVRMGPMGMPPYRVELSSEPAAVRPGTSARLRLTVRHPVSGALVTDFTIVHERPFHLFVVSDDLSYFDHIHPQAASDGAYEVSATFPSAGLYHLYCDFLPASGTPQMIHQRIRVGEGPSKARPALTPDMDLSKTVDGIRFDLSLEPQKPAADHAMMLSFHLVDAATGEPVADLQPYLGAWGHTLMLSADAESTVHAHPVQVVPVASAGAVASGGPDVAFNVTVREPGLHRLWSQFMRGGKVITVPFTIDVARVDHLASWDGRGWAGVGHSSPGGPDGPVRAIALRGSEVFAGGDFSSVGGAPAAGLARWDGKRWSALGQGVNGVVRAVAVAGPDVYVGGEFTRAGDVETKAVARWDGRRFRPLGSGIGGTKDAVRPAAVYAITVRGRDVYLGGRFMSAGGREVNGIVRWDGTSFTPLSTGVASGSYDGIVWAMAFFKDELYVGGQFLTAGGEPARNIARWDGKRFHPLGEGIAGGLERVLAVAAFRDRLFVGGDFTVVGGVPARQIAVWDGARWQDPGISTSESVRAIAAGRDGVFLAGGSFALGSMKTSGVVRWDGKSWSPLSGGLASGSFLAPVFALAPGPELIYAGGGPFIVR